MAQLIRVIWRLDYNVSYAYLDSPGTVLRILAETVPGFVPNLSEGIGNHSFVAERKGNGEYTTIATEPASLIGSMEWAEGVELSRVLSHDNFRNCEKIAKALLHHFQVKLVNRAGIRFFFLERQPGVLKNNSMHTEFIQPGLLSRSARALGPAADVGVVIEGTREDKLSFRANFGPSAYKNFNISMSQNQNASITEEQYKKLFASYNIFCDLDIFENNFMMIEGSIYRWAKSKLEIAVEFAQSFMPAQVARER